jgi:hypothetical protein
LFQHFEQTFATPSLGADTRKIVGEGGADVMSDEGWQQVVGTRGPARLDHILAAEQTHVAVAVAMIHFGGRSFRRRGVHVAVAGGKLGYSQNTSAFVFTAGKIILRRLAAVGILGL